MNTAGSFSSSVMNKVLNPLPETYILQRYVLYSL
jgi:hypothetical protein